MRELPITIYTVELPGGVKNLVGVLPYDVVFARGLPGHAIVGELRRPLEPGEAITPGVFVPNRMFVEFMHDVIARHGPRVAGLIEEARQQGEGWVYLIDGRTPTPCGEVPGEDIIGAFEARGGTLAPGSYRPNPHHLILSANGFVQLDTELEEALVQALMSPFEGLAVERPNKH